MRRLLVLLAITCAAVAPEASGQPLSLDQINDAIRTGLAGKQKDLLLECEAVMGFREMLKSERSLDPRGGFRVTLSLTTGRIAVMAAAARRLYKPFGPADVPDDLKAAGVLVDIEPEPPEASPSRAQSIWYTAPIQQVVIKAFPNAARFILPNATQLEPLEWKDVPGGPLKGNHGRVRFSVGDVRELPPGYLQIAVVTEAGERTCLVPDRDRKRIFGS